MHSHTAVCSGTTHANTPQAQPMPGKPRYAHPNSTRVKHLRIQTQQMQGVSMCWLGFRPSVLPQADPNACLPACRRTRPVRPHTHTASSRVWQLTCRGRPVPVVAALSIRQIYPSACRQGPCPDARQTLHTRQGRPTLKTVESGEGDGVQAAAADKYAIRCCALLPLLAAAVLSLANTHCAACVSPAKGTMGLGLLLQLQGKDENGESMHNPAGHLPVAPQRPEASGPHMAGRTLSGQTA